MEAKQCNSTPLGEATPASSEMSKTPVIKLDTAVTKNSPSSPGTATKKKHKYHRTAHSNKNEKIARKHISLSSDSSSSSSEDDLDSDDESDRSSDASPNDRIYRKDISKVIRETMLSMQKRSKHGRRPMHTTESLSSAPDESEVSDHNRRRRRRRMDRSGRETRNTS